MSRQQVVFRAQEQQGGATEPEASGTAASTTTQQQPAAAPAAPAPAAAPKPAVIQEGQTTAIVTGAISVIFGVAYLALVYVMDSRGGEMLPPPPEAFLP